MAIKTFRNVSNNPSKDAVFAQPDGSIKIDRIYKNFKNAAGEFTVLKGIDLSIPTGEFASIVGKSGSGKSTLLNMMTGIDHPTSGNVVIGQTNIHQLSESQRAYWRGVNLGIVFQFFQLLPMLSLLENTMLPMDYTNTYRPGDRQSRAMELLEMVGLDNVAFKLPAAVSSGQQQSAAIARALATNPPIIVADEPTGNLDSRSAQNIIQLFQKLVEQGKTILIVTHDPSLTTLTNRTIIISDGEIINETVARALPLLSHRQMLDITHLIKPKTVQPGEEILKAGREVASFYIVQRGEVDVVLQSRRCDELMVTKLNPGQFFGEIELLRGGGSLATIRCSLDGPAELLELPYNEFIHMLEGSPLTKDAIGKIVQARIEENRIMTRKCK